MPKTKNANYPADYEPSDQETDNDSPPHAPIVPFTRGRSHAASSSQVPQVDISDQFDAPFAIYTEAEGARFGKLQSRDFTDAKIMCRVALTGLGIEETIRRYLNIWGLQGLEDSPHDSYKEITYEFLTTLRKHSDELKFRLHGIEYVVNQELLRQVFHMGVGGVCAAPRDFDYAGFWLEITGTDDYRVSNAKSSLIRDAPLQIVYKWYAESVCGKKESTKVSKDELVALYALVHPDELKLNMPFRILHMLFEMAKPPGEYKRVIGMGNIIYALARHFRAFSQIEVNRMTLVEAEVMDLRYLKAANLATDTAIIPWFDRRTFIRRGMGQNPVVEEEEAAVDAAAEVQQNEVPAQGLEQQPELPVSRIMERRLTAMEQRQQRHIAAMERRQQRMWASQQIHERYLRDYLRASHPEGDYPSPVHELSPPPEDI